MTRSANSRPGRRPLLAAGLAALSLFSLPGLALAADPPKVIRIGAPEQGAAGKSFAGASAFGLIHANKALEAEFAKDGIEVQWSLFKGAGPAVNEGLATGQLDLVFLGDLAGVIGRANGLKTRLVAASGRGANSYLAVPLGSDIKDFKDLKGKRVAVLRGTAYQLPFDRLLREAGLTEKDVRFTNLDWPTSKAALVTKDIDATVGGADLQLLKYAGTAEIATSTKGRGPIYGINAALIAADDFAGKHPELLVRVLKVFVRQAHEIASDDAARREALFQRYHEASGLPVALYKGEFEGTSVKERNSPLLDAGFVAHYGNVIEGALAAKIIRRGFDAKGWADPSFVNRAVKELGLDGYWTAAPAVAAK